MTTPFFPRLVVASLVASLIPLTSYAEIVLGAGSHPSETHKLAGVYVSGGSINLTGSKQAEIYEFDSFSTVADGDEFQFRITALSGWDSASATAALADFGSYFNFGEDSPLREALLNGSKTGTGVATFPTLSRIDDTEAVIYTLETLNLNESNKLVFSGFNLSGINTNEEADLLIYDSKTNSVIYDNFLVTGDDQEVTTISTGEIALEEGFQFIIARNNDGGSGGFQSQGLTLNVVEIPEPSSYVLLAGLLTTACLLGLRRK
ncbi:MAG: hypothetical protein ACPGN3_13235 [Opitutales bacterium]